MSDSIRIQSALISVYSKEGLEPLIHAMAEQGIQFISTGGTGTFIEQCGYTYTPVEQLTGYPAILDGRVKTLHPAIFGGILARREDAHLAECKEHQIALIDCVIVDLYPFEKTVASTSDESAIIEKIDIGGISLIRATAKNYAYTTIISDQSQYGYLKEIMDLQGGVIQLDQRKHLASEAWGVTSHYDTAIQNYFTGKKESQLRYGENPHQKAWYQGDLSKIFTIIQGKELSFNNLLDVDAGWELLKDLVQYTSNPNKSICCILKHNNACGVAIADSMQAAWEEALAADPVSAFGGVILISGTVDGNTARKMDTLFYEICIATQFTEEALSILQSKKNRILCTWTKEALNPLGGGMQIRSVLGGILRQEWNQYIHRPEELRIVTQQSMTEQEKTDACFAAICVKHMKSNAVVIARNQVLITMGCGMTSRVDALQFALRKAASFQRNVKGGVLASEAFFPFADCVTIAHEAGIHAVIQPGGSIKDADSIAYCDAHGMTMACTGIRHFKH